MGRGGGAGGGSEIWQELMGTAWVPDLDSKMGRGLGGQRKFDKKITAGGKSAPNIFGVCIPSMRMLHACFSGRGKKKLQLFFLLTSKKSPCHERISPPSCSNNKGPLLLQAQIWFWFFFLSFFPHRRSKEVFPFDSPHLSFCRINTLWNVAHPSAISLHFDSAAARTKQPFGLWEAPPLSCVRERTREAVVPKYGRGFGGIIIIFWREEGKIESCLAF